MDEAHAPAQAAPLQAKPGKPGPAATRWLAELPPKLCPNETASRFPHIVDALSSRWANAAACRTYFDELLLDQRGNRRGFPENVVRELVALKNHYDSAVFPTHQTVWDELVGRRRG